jgi:hypothetical protein
MGDGDSWAAIELAERLAAQGDGEGAERAYRAAMASADPECRAAATFALGWEYKDRGDLTNAQALLEQR